MNDLKTNLAVRLYTINQEGGLGQWLEYQLVVQWITGSIPAGGPIELFPISASAPQLV